MDQSNITEVKKKSAFKRLLKVVLWVVIIVALVMIVAILSCGRIAKWYLEKHSKELTGRIITVERITMNPLFGTAKIKDLKVLEANDKDLFLGFGELDYRMNLLGLMHKKFKMRRLHIDNMDLNILQTGKSFNFDDLITRFSSDSSAKKETDPGWTVDLNNIKISDSRMRYKDLEVGSNFGFNRMNVEIPRIYLTGKDTDAGIQLHFEDGGSLGCRLSYNMDHSRYNLDLNISGFGIDGILPYLQQYMNVSKCEGLLSMNVNINGDTEHITEAKVKGTVDVVKSEVVDDQGRMIFAADSVGANILELSTAGRITHLAYLNIVGPQSQYIIYKDSTDNFSYLMKSTPEIAEEPDAVEEVQEDVKKMILKVDRLRIAGGKVGYEDNLMKGGFKYSLSEISAFCNDFQLDKMNRIIGRAVLGKAGKVALDWTTDFKSMRNMHLKLTARNVDITDFTPYSLVYVGNEIENGVLQIESDNTVTDNKLNGENKIEVYKPKVSKRKNKKPVYKVPVRLGVYVLTDKEGMMKVSLPVSGDLDNPQFSYRKILFKALMNLFVKVASAPITAIGSLFSSDEPLDHIDIDVTEPDFDTKQYTQLTELVEAVKEKDELKYQFNQRFNLEQAVKDHPDFTEDKLLTLAKLRNENLEKFLKRMNVKSSQITVNPIVTDSLKVYSGDPSIHLTALWSPDND